MELTVVSQTNQEYVITLKEITDLIGVRHDKSMAKVEELAIENGFGTLSKIDIVYNDKGQTIAKPMEDISRFLLLGLYTINL